MVPRRVLTPFLPDTIETTYQKSPVAWQGQLYYFTADNNKVRYCKEGDADWTDCVGSNTIVTNNGGKPKFLRVLDAVLIMNGTNGDKLAYVDLTTTGFPVVKYLPVADPTVAPTAAGTNLTTTSGQPFNVYYAYSYTSTTGATLISPILTVPVNIVRDDWGKNTASPSSVKISRPAGIPANAAYWDVYVANSAQYGTIQTSDMLRVASKLDLATVDFVDDGTLSIDLGAPAHDRQQHRRYARPPVLVPVLRGARRGWWYGPVQQAKIVPLAEAAAIFASQGFAKDKPVVAYCGGGISATIDLFQLYRLGYDHLSLYDGSMGEWAKDASLPIETGLNRFFVTAGHSHPKDGIAFAPCDPAIHPKIDVIRGSSPRMTEALL